jgi:hypothetical protein
VNGDGGCAAVEFLASLLFQLYRSDSGRRDRSHLACKLSELLPDHSHRVDPSKLCDIVCQCLSTWALADGGVAFHCHCVWFLFVLLAMVVL